MITKFTFIMLVNLFAFLGVGYILDGFFETGVKIRVGLLLLSIIPLVFLSKKIFKDTLDGIEKISPKENNDNVTKKYVSK